MNYVKPYIKKNKNKVGLKTKIGKAVVRSFVTFSNTPDAEKFFSVVNSIYKQKNNQEATQQCVQLMSDLSTKSKSN